MLNRITITGRLTAAPELRKTNNDISVTSFSIANQRNYKNAEGEFSTDFFDIVAWRNTAEFVTRYFTKGSLITIDGRLESRKYTDKDGNKRTAIEIVADNVYFGDSKSDAQKTANATAGTTETETAGDISTSGDPFTPSFGDVSDDDLPFEPFA